MVRPESQRERLANYLNDVKEWDKRIIIERLLVDIDFRLLAIVQKVEYSKIALIQSGLVDLNDKAKKLKINDRFLTLETLLRLKPETYNEVWPIIQKEGGASW
jgi:hypothetical protein